MYSFPENVMADCWTDMKLIFGREKKDCVAHSPGQHPGFVNPSKGWKYFGSTYICIVCFYLWAKINKQKQNNSLKSSFQYSTKSSWIFLFLYIFSFEP